MKREDLEHLIAAAATVSGEDEILILGSQALLAQFADAPDELLESMEADLLRGGIGVESCPGIV